LEVERGKDIPMHVSANQTLTITLEMLPVVEVRGYVVDPDGRPAKNASVELTGPMINDRRSARADCGEDGSFIFADLLPGSFTLLARGLPATIMKDNQRLATVPTYWPNAADPAAAPKIVLSGAAPVSSFNIQLQRSPVYRVAGSVETPEGEPAKGAIVNLLRIRPQPYLTTRSSDNGALAVHLPSRAYEVVDSTTSSQDGAFEFQTLLEGEWIVQATGPLSYQPRQPNQTPMLINQTLAQTNVQVSRKDIQHISLHLQNSFAVEARLETDSSGSEFIPPSCINAILIPSEAGRRPSIHLLRGDGTGSFAMVYPGQYKLYMVSAATPGIYASRVLLGGDDVLGQTMTLTASSPPIQIICKQGAGTIQANIEKEAPGTIVLLPGIGPSVDAPRSAISLPGKPSQFANLRPGEYYAAAFDHIDPTRLSDPLFVASLIPLGKRLTVEEKSNIRLQLPLNRWPE
jgi:hypothetical protein